MSAAADRLTEDDYRELARLMRGIHARAAAKRERLERERQDDQASRDGDDRHDAA